MSLAGGSGGGATIPPASTGPSGPAGGSLAGTYPNPSIAALAVTDANVAAANKDGAAATPSLRTLGTTAVTATAGNDARLSNARTPTAHAISHESGGTDAVPGVDALVAGANVTVDATDPRNPIVAAAAAAGSSLPIADPAGIVVDTTTYPNPITGIGNIDTVVFPAETTVAAWAITGDAFPRAVIGADPNDFGALFVGDGTFDPVNTNTGGVMGFGNPGWEISGGIRSNGDVKFSTAAFGPCLGTPTMDPRRLNFASDAGAVGSTALDGSAPWVAADAAVYTNAGPAVPVTAATPVNLVSGVGQLLSAAIDLHVALPVTFTPTALLTATCAVALSFDAGGSYTTLYTVTLPALAALAGLSIPVVVDVPVNALLQVTVTNATIGAGSAYP